MNVLLIWDGEYPWDVRIEKVCDTLLRDGHEVHLICRNQRRRPRTENCGGIRVHRIAALRAGLGAVLNDAFTFPAFFNPVWWRELRAVGRSASFDVVIVRDLPMAVAGIWLARLLQTPVVLDMAECYPELIRAVWQFERFRPSNIFVRNPFIADWLERWVVQRMDQIWVMVDESKARLIKKGVNASNIRIVSNTPRVNTFQRKPVRPIGRVDQLRLVYVGLVNPSRGLDIVIRAVAQLKNHWPRPVLEVYGTGKAMQELLELAASLGIEDAVRFHGWIDRREVPSVIQAADVGIVPHLQCSHWNNTIPNKLFDYMAAGVPVLVSDVRPAARIVSSETCGLVYAAASPEDLAAKLVAMSVDDTRSRLGANGRIAVERTYRWDIDERGITLGLEQLRQDQ